MKIQAASSRASSDIKFLFLSPSRLQMVAILSLLGPRNVPPFDFSTKRPDNLKRSTMIRIASALLPSLISRTRSHQVPSLFLVLAHRTLSIDQPEREKQAQVYVSRHRKSSNFFVSLPSFINRSSFYDSRIQVFLHCCGALSLLFCCLESS